MAVTLSLFAGAGAQFFDNNGNVLSGGKIYTYQAGTTTPLATYTSNSESAFHTNPIILDSAGRVPSGGEIWLQLGVGYKFVLRTSADVLIATYDNIPSSAQPPVANDADSIMYEQGYTVTAGSFVVGKIYRIASVGTTNFTLIGAVNNTVGTHFIATGAGSGTGTAELSQTVETKLRQTISVSDFGAIGNGVADDTAAIQAAIDSRASVGGVISFPAGIYKITASLTWYSTVSEDVSGISFVGEGRNSTTLKSYIANGPMFDIRGTKSFASGGSGSRFFNGGGFYGMLFDGTNATGTSDAIYVQGWQYAEIVDCRIDTFPRDGIRQWVDTGFPNADYSSSSINIIDTWIWDCVGVGVNQTGPIGAFSWQFDKSLFGYCGLGANITSAGNSFFDCSFVGNGYSPAGVPRSGGSHLQIGSSSGGTNRIAMQGCEFDFARLAHVKLDYCSTIDISQSRFIFNDRNSTGSLTPSVGGVVIAPDGAGSNANSVLITNCNIRIDTPGICNAFYIVNTSNVQGIQVNGTVFSNNSGATLNKYLGFTGSSNLNLRNDYSATEISASPTYVQGRPKDEYIGIATSTTVPASAIIVFGGQQALNAQIFSNTLYNTTTGVYTCVTTGYYDVYFSLSVQGATTAEYYQIQPRINGVAATEWQFTGTGLTRTLMSAYHRVFCTAGQTLDIFNSGSSGKTITLGFSQLVIKLVG
jgi:hypothetical protein